MVACAPVANGCSVPLVEAIAATDAFPEADGNVFNPTWQNPYVPDINTQFPNIGYLQIISNEIVQGRYTPVAPLTIPGPSSLRWSGFATSTTHQYSQLTFRSITQSAIANSDQAYMWVAVRMQQRGVGNSNDQNLSGYFLMYVIFYTSTTSTTVQGTGLTLWRRTASGASLTAIFSLGNGFNFPVPVLTPGDQLRLIAINQANTNVCLDCRLNDVQLTPVHIDSSASRILTGQPGIGWGFTASLPGPISVTTRLVHADDWQGVAMLSLSDAIAAGYCGGAPIRVPSRGQSMFPNSRLHFPGKDKGKL
jgi:hypothetical protein